MAVANRAVKGNQAQRKLPKPSAGAQLHCERSDQCNCALRDFAGISSYAAAQKKMSKITWLAVPDIYNPLYFWILLKHFPELGKLDPADETSFSGVAGALAFLANDKNFLTWCCY